jgi:DNA modification methylase
MRATGVTSMSEIKQGDSVAILKTLPDESVNCVITSPPYWNLRDYGAEGQLGLEKTPEEYVAGMVAVFREVRRVLRDDGTLWLNLGDSYAGSTMTGGTGSKETGRREARMIADRNTGFTPDGLKPKDLCGIPWRVAFALQAAGWWLRSDIIWSKPNPMPESVTDRCTKAHEYIFLLSKQARYFYDAKAIAEAAAGWNGSEFDDGKNEISHPNVGRNRTRKTGEGTDSEIGTKGCCGDSPSRNRRSVWTIPTQSFKGAHFATFPEKLVEPCILAGCPEGGVVLDPFGGSGTVGVVAKRLKRNYILIELKPEYCEMARRRIAEEPPTLF